MSQSKVYLKGIKKVKCTCTIIIKYDVIKRRILMNVFFKPQFNCSPLVWMCCNRYLNNKINRLHEQCLRILYNDQKLSFEELHERDGSVCIHHQNMKFLQVEMFKVFRGISPQIRKEIVHFRDTILYQLRKQTDLQILSVHSVLSDRFS